MYIYCRKWLIGHHHWAAVVSRYWAKASACRLQVSLSCAFLCQIVSLQYLSRSSLRRLAGLPCILLSFGLHVVTREIHRSSLRRLMYPSLHCNCSHVGDYDFCLLPDPDVSPSVRVCDVEHTSFHFGLCGRNLLCAC